MKKLLLYIMFSNSYIYAKVTVSMEEKITALYVAYFKRAADHEGLAYWNNQVNQAKTEVQKLTILKRISSEFSQQTIFTDIYSQMNNRTFVEAIYKNILGKGGDIEGINYWVSLLDKGVSRSDIVAIFIDTTMSSTISTETFPNLSSKEIKDANLRQVIIKNRVAVSLYFTYSLREFSNINTVSTVEDDLAYRASQAILLSLYHHPFDKTIAINFIDNAVKNDNPIEFILNNKFITISGAITYVRPLLNSNHIGLSPNRETINPAQQVVVKLLNEENNILSQTTTNNQGEYSFFYIPKNTKVKVQVYSIMEQKESLDNWNIKVTDNTRNNAIYSIQGQLASTKDCNNIRNITIPLQSKKSAPFSILDDIYKSMKKITNIKSVSFPPLTINWSINNNSSQGRFEDGQIGTSFFDGKNSIYLLGDSNSDSDEFDSSVIIHEWSHYFETKFSRADTIGGSHGEGERLDIRVAFSEGFGNAWSAMVTDNPIYADTTGARGWFIDVEHDDTIDAGWWSESSIQKIIYDLYDGKNESHDKISLGLEPIYNILTTTQKETKAFTSIFSFITLLKEKNSLYASQIDRLLLKENIEGIENDIYGEAYHNLYSDSGEQICTSSQYGGGNKLFNHKYLRFTIDTQKSYTIRVEQINGDDTDPDFNLYQTEPFRFKREVSGSQNKIESSSLFLTTGDYLLDISDYNNINKACFNITIE